MQASELPTVDVPVGFSTAHSTTGRNHKMPPRLRVWRFSHGIDLLSKSMTFEKRPRRAQARPQDERAKLWVFPVQERTRLPERHTRESSGQCRKGGGMTSLAAPRHAEEGIRCRGFSSASTADANRCTTANRPRPAHPSSITAP